MVCRSSSHWRCSIRKDVLKTFAKFIGKQLCSSLFFNKVADLRPVTLLKKEILTQAFFLWIFWNFYFFIEHLQTTASACVHWISPFHASGPFFILPENIRKSLVFWSFQEAHKATCVMKWVYDRKLNNNAGVTKLKSFNVSISKTNILGFW